MKFTNVFPQEFKLLHYTDVDGPDSAVLLAHLNLNGCV